MFARKKWDDELTRLTKAVVTAAALVRKLVKIPNEETEPETSQRITRWEAAEAELSKAQAHESAKVGLVYELFCKNLKEDPELQWEIASLMICTPKILGRI